MELVEVIFFSFFFSDSGAALSSLVLLVPCGYDGHGCFCFPAFRSYVVYVRFSFFAAEDTRSVPLVVTGEGLVVSSLVLSRTLSNKALTILSVRDASDWT